MKKKKYIIILVVLLSTILIFYFLAFVVREWSITNLSDYYKNAARRECRLEKILFPFNNCLYSVHTAANSKYIIAEDGVCPERLLPHVDLKNGGVTICSHITNIDIW